jgi:hypothetical protein
MEILRDEDDYDKTKNLSKYFKTILEHIYKENV